MSKSIQYLADHLEAVFELKKIDNDAERLNILYAIMEKEWHMIELRDALRAIREKGEKESWESVKKELLERAQEKGNDREERDWKPRCYTCREIGHISKDCRAPRSRY
ncbi:hypothetical protein NEHOM01_1871 [Nematocida homosporus]|nr:uncharacterized protein NEHOM01_1851 [Nematocida homosporus]XP_051346709.1 uncharacterized protein NEHOM01_1871 [Nematocida homosporus]KAI5186999.1 hypothetical protein NEHOM01_1851 [Nematocida homosporus]KAI5187019.1 hypothetical protein NEHOM01_1871 [Nematocida homosporus]